MDQNTCRNGTEKDLFAKIFPFASWNFCISERNVIYYTHHFTSNFVDNEICFNKQKYL